MLDGNEGLDLSRNVRIVSGMNTEDPTYWNLIVRFIEIVFMQDKKFQRPIGQCPVEDRA
jgi:hypothetical protein